ncbi:hypothetical protein METHPM2_40102 [Pseudomonas sp. PM2]
MDYYFGVNKISNNETETPVNKS